MSWYPSAVRALISKHDTLLKTYNRVILHTAVSSARSLYNWHQKVDHCSHFYIAADGYVEQYVDTKYIAPNQYEGNYDSISIETQDKGYPFPAWSESNVPPWTRKQIDAIVLLLQWINEEHGIPLIQLSNSRPGTRGIGWHRQGIDGNFPSTGILAGRVEGGEVWSDPGKPCPGDNRIRQIPGIIELAKLESEGPMFSLQDLREMRIRKARPEEMGGNSSLQYDDFLSQIHNFAWMNLQAAAASRELQLQNTAVLKSIEAMIAGRTGEPLELIVRRELQTDRELRQLEWNRIIELLQERIEIPDNIAQEVVDEMGRAFSERNTS